METNEQVKTALLQAAEQAIVNLLERVQQIQVGDLKGVEHEVLSSVFAIGCSTLQCLLQAQPEMQAAPTRRIGECGHEQRLVGQRPKQVLTLMGPSRSNEPITSVCIQQRNRMGSRAVRMGRPPPIRCGGSRSGARVREYSRP